MSRLLKMERLAKFFLPVSQAAPVGDVEMQPFNANANRPTQVEEYRRGYPRFSALIAANPDFFVFRRFLRLRARLLLLKQDELSVLESQLDQVDENETRPLFLGNSRRDQNAARALLLSKIDSRVREYDSLLDRTHKTLSINEALTRDILSLRNWINGTGSLCRDETKFLDYGKELISLASYNDKAIKGLEDWVEDALVCCYKGFRRLPRHDSSVDPNVYIYSGWLVKGLAKALMLLLITLLLLTPVVICAVLTNIWAKIFVVIISTVLYLTTLSRITGSRMIELILAGATFATVLTVFLSSVGVSSA